MLQRRLPLLITFITGVIIVVTFFIPHPPFGKLQDDSLVWYSIILGFSMLIGVDSLLRFHYRKIARREKGFWYSFVFYVGFFACLITGIISEIKFKDAFAEGTSFRYLYDYILIPLQSTMFALLAFFVASASYRAFRARNFIATLLLITAVIVMLGRIPYSSNIPGITQLTDWILNVLQLGPARGIRIGIALGAISMSLRLILGIERTYLS